MHARLRGIPHASPEYVERIHSGLADVTWPGRCQKLQDSPDVWLDGAIHTESANSLVESLRDYLKTPVISILAVPSDKDYVGVYAALGPVSQSMILTETARNPSLHFLNPESAINAARPYNSDVSYAKMLSEAVEQAKIRAGKNGTIIIAGTQSILADAMAIWGYSYEQI